jgi:hypothetical protein
MSRYQWKPEAGRGRTAPQHHHQTLVEMHGEIFRKHNEPVVEKQPGHSGQCNSKRALTATNKEK